MQRSPISPMMGSKQIPRLQTSMQSAIYKKIGQYTVFITPVTLNDAQRRFSALKAKEDQGYWTGSISCEAFRIASLSSAPTRLAVMEEAIEKLKSYGHEITLEDLAAGNA